MADVKIFVSHRIDIDSELIDNPVYVPVRCGAVFDDENPMGIAGDDTGENISERRMSFCEFTVQYWAWKNVQADYYGLCHYRRYLSFAEKQFKTDEFNMVYRPALLPAEKKRFGLLDPQRMKELVEGYDVIVSESADVHKIHSPDGKKQTVRQLWDAHDGVFFEKKYIDTMFELIDRFSPEYSVSAREYFSGDRHRGFNCYVLKKELFERLCRFQFPIMEEMERRIDTTGYTQTMKRTPAFIGEMLYGIFIYHITTYEQWRVKEVQLVFFRDTERIRGKGDLVKRYVLRWGDQALRAVLDPIFPKGSARREVLKKIAYTILPLKQRGVAEVKEEDKKNG